MSAVDGLGCMASNWDQPIRSYCTRIAATSSVILHKSSGSQWLTGHVFSIPEAVCPACLRCLTVCFWKGRALVEAEGYVWHSDYLLLPTKSNSTSPSCLAYNWDTTVLIGYQCIMHHVLRLTLYPFCWWDLPSWLSYSRHGFAPASMSINADFLQKSPDRTHMELHLVAQSVCPPASSCACVLYSLLLPSLYQKATLRVLLMTSSADRALDFRWIYHAGTLARNGNTNGVLELWMHNPRTPSVAIFQQCRGIAHQGLLKCWYVFTRWFEHDLLTDIELPTGYPVSGCISYCSPATNSLRSSRVFITHAIQWSEKGCQGACWCWGRIRQHIELHKLNI